MKMRKWIAILLCLLLVGYVCYDAFLAKNPAVIEGVDNMIANVKNMGSTTTPVVDGEGNPVLNEDGTQQTEVKYNSVSLFVSNFLKLSLRYSNFYTEGVRNTLILAALTLLLGTILGTLMALMRISGFKPLEWFATTYIEIFRGTPLMVQLLFIYYGTPLCNMIPNVDIPFITDFPRMMTCVIVMSLNSCAYVAEIIRSGIQAVDGGQMEAANSLGFSRGQAMKLVVLPQAVKNILPALGNEFITVIKESSIVIYVGVADLMYRAKGVTSKTYITLESYLIAALLYLVMTFCMSTFVGYLERKLKRDLRGSRRPMMARKEKKA
ncbi:MAG: amino acid ABC transporter permease [Clostridia bacterium]|nr:amino acid ABC transporter permease [Clostridia bacterium]